MERLAEQIVDWHNRHPLARRIGVEDVHTIGVVALPFVRTSAEAGGFVEPVLTDAVSAFDELHGSPPASRGAVWLQRLKELPARLPQLLGRGKRTQWRAFNEKFIPGLSPARIEAFALAHGFAEAPATPDTRPWRVIVIDEALAAKRGGWPFELYLMSAGVDVGGARTRVLSGRGIPSEIVGSRLWHPVRVGIAAAVLLVPAAVAAWLLWPRSAPAPVPPAPAAAASAASMPAPGPLPSAPAVMAPASAAASAPASETSASAPAAASAAASAVEAAASDAPTPDIRPRLVERADGKRLPPLGGGKPPESVVEKPVEKAPATPVEAPAKTTEPAKAEPPDPRLARMAEAPGTQAVALVGPAGSKADAEALLVKMKAGLVGVHSNPDALQADVIKTPEGWRATVWPFPSREQAQLINATLVARGLKTKAVNF
ncbi:hypothetical protein [Roseateles asaccharophilus]|uniref:SPOR domain-containing protein n=1 Tax=Roseateles asaccharophilus TaxID=582607 RepID=A0ABU2A960_9BURK|nr:hypothetical protein [Roseateles asaccharophilus]MDR7333545.1 hypothetical protein [Roseateles asaccharophilus]